MKQTIRYNIVMWAMLMLWLLPADAQQAKQYFVSMPDTILPLLTEINRADCIDFLESNMRAIVTNRLDGKSEMTTLTDNYIEIKLSEQSSWQMKVLALNDSTQVLCTVFTACAPACDSHIKFYTTQWESLSLADYIQTMPTLSDYLPQLNEADYDIQTLNAVKQADLLLIKMQLSADDNTLVCSFDTPQYMEKSAAQKLTPLLQKPIVYKWNSGKFVRK
jgi:hypothetical protein